MSSDMVGTVGDSGGATTARRIEDATTRAIWDLLSPADDPVLAAAAAAALLAGVGPAERHLIPRTALWGFLPSQGPDLLLLDDDNRVRAVIEHKRGAAAQVTALSTVRSVPAFDDPVARRVTADGDPAWHEPQAGGSCGCMFHTQIRDGRVRAGVWQIDGYRASPWWMRGPSGQHGVVLDDPRTVLWVLLDRDGRAAADVFPGAATADVWHTTSYPAFATGLRAAAVARAGDARATAYLGEVLDLIGQ